MSSDKMFTVAVRHAYEVQVGDTIWDAECGEWLKVARIGGKHQPTFFRRDRSEFAVEYDESKVLVRL